MLSFINRVSSRSSKVDVTNKDAEVADTAQTQTGEGPTLVTQYASANSEQEEGSAGDVLQADMHLAPDARTSVSIYSSDVVQEDSAPDPATSSAALSVVPVSHDAASELKGQSSAKPRRLSWRPLSFKFLNNQDAEENKPALSLEKEQRKKLQVVEDKAKRAARISSADKKAKESAVLVRSLIVGPTGITLPKSKPISKPKIAKVKSQLLNPKSANRVIAQLRALPSIAETLPGQPGEGGEHIIPTAAAPIHAVHLPYTEAEADEKHFNKLSKDAESGDGSVGEAVGSVYNASATQLHTTFSDMKVISLIGAPAFGIGEPGDGDGILSGAIPTAKTVLDGVQQITPQLMALGYATGKSIMPDHAGIHPPTDRMSVLTYWWGFEIAMPPPSIEYLSRAPSISHSVINVLTALSAVNGGVREILPFVRYISQYIDAEFNMIKQQDHGKGVVCAATWLVPVALVPRPWDFAPAPVVTIQPATEDDSSNEEPKTEDPISPPLSPSLPPSRPVSPPTLLPPLAIHETAFGETDHDKPAKSPPVDETSVEIDEATATQTGIPAVAIVPPTPTASGIKSGGADEDYSDEEA